MDYKEYKQMVIDSEKGSLTDYPKILHAIMGMNGEAGECVDILKKHIFQGHDLDVNHLLNELGDVCWYTMLLIIVNDIDPKLIFEYHGKLLYNEDILVINEDLGMSYILVLNKNCGLGVDLLKFNNFKPPLNCLLTIIREVFYSIRRAANCFDKTLEDIFDINCIKIKQRYPEGFNPEMSVNRDVVSVAPEWQDNMRYLMVGRGSKR